MITESDPHLRSNCPHKKRTNNAKTQPSVVAEQNHRSSHSFVRSSYQRIQCSSSRSPPTPTFTSAAHSLTSHQSTAKPPFSLLQCSSHDLDLRVYFGSVPFFDSPPGSTEKMSATEELTYSEVSSHSNKKDLYVVIHDKVHNASSFVDEHP